MTLPWWDWVDEAGIPTAYDTRTIGGKPKPLYASPIAPYATKRRPEWPRRTSREVGANPGPVPPPLRGRWDWVMEPTSYREFTRRITLLHNNIHGWVGGSMGQIDWAAYDPIFWPTTRWSTPLADLATPKPWRLAAVGDPGRSVAAREAANPDGTLDT